MNFAIPFKNYERLALLLLWLLTAVSRADVDAGGGITSGGSIWNQSSIGSPIETGSNSSATYSVTSGMIEVLFTNSESSSNPDADTNGLPDAWEIQNFGHTGVDLLADADGDGTTNVMEYVAGTDPRSAASRFQPVGAYSGSLFTMPIETTTGFFAALATRMASRICSEAVSEPPGELTRRTMAFTASVRAAFRIAPARSSE